MQVRFRNGAAVLAPETEAERRELAAWAARHDGFVFALDGDGSGGARLAPLGPRAEACREPINVYSANPDPRIAIVANFAPTPFTLDGMRYACVEAFWQSLRFPQEERARIAPLDGFAAKRISEERPYGSHVHYRGEAIPVGAFAHWQLMRRACEAKFLQNADARAALLATGDRPLVHRVNPDSRTIPGAIMAEIWMALRAKLRGDPEPSGD
jgi:predicted NAD-dependent protein-ADP-ribosyltransferase YbiA (DUF1768 family)